MANIKISDLTAASVAADANEFEINEAGTSKKVTGSQIKAYVNSADGALASKDTVATADIDADAVDGTKIADNAISNEHIATDAVNADSIAANAVGASEINVSGNGTSGQVLASDGDGTMTWTDVSSGGGYTIHLLTSGTTFYPQASSTKMYVAVYGATGGGSQNRGGGTGGSGFSEKYYNTGSLASSYSYSVGAGGAQGGSGGTTTFDVMTVTGSVGQTSTAGTAGGVGSGGDFNATGGSGGNGDGTADGGGKGGDACRAGNGGNGANETGTQGGGGGGSGGNNASGNSGGAAATAKAAGALDLATIFGITHFHEQFQPGAPGGSTPGGWGAQAWVITSSLMQLYYTDGRITGTSAYNYGIFTGESGYILVVEW